MNLKKLGFLFFFLILNSGYPQNDIPLSVQEKVLKVISKITPSLVRIYAILPNFFQGRENKVEVSGSGTVITEDGFVITNYHVAGNARFVRCKFLNGEEYDGYYYAGDPLTDIAIIKIKGKRKKFTSLKFGDSSKLKLGEWVIAAGSPYGVSPSITIGVISNLSVVIPDLWGPFYKFKIDGEDVGSHVCWIAHDAPIYSGNSGGPLLNLNGEIIGINEIKLGLSGAIPGNLAKKVALELIKNKKVKRAWFGIEIQPLLKSLDIKNGVLISNVIKDSPAYKAGLKQGDIILEIENKKVNVEKPEDIPIFNQFISELPIGKNIKFLVDRNGNKNVIYVKSVERPKIYCEQKEIKKLGIICRNISDYEKIEIGRNDKEGVLITSIRPGGPSGECKPFLKEKDVIVKINEYKIKNVEDLMNFLDCINEDTSLVLTFERGKEKIITVVEIKKESDQYLIPKVKKGWLPVDIQVLTEKLKKSLNLDINGVMITAIYTDDEFPLKQGDIILKVEGEAINPRNPEDRECFFDIISEYKPGSEIEITLLRNNKLENVKTIIQEEPKDIHDVEKFKDEILEISVRDICFYDIKKYGKIKEGVIVEEVKEGGWGSISRLSIGDIITSINGKKIKNVNEFKEKLLEIRKKKKNIIFTVERGISNFFIEIDITGGEK